MISENIKTKGSVQFILTDENGVIKSDTTVPNLVVTSGLAYIASRVRDASAAVMSHMAVGTSTTAAAAAQTALVTEAGRVALGSTVVSTTTVTNDATTYSATFGPGVAAVALTEAAILNAASAGTMLCRTVFPVVNKGNLDTLTINWKVTVAP